MVKIKILSLLKPFDAGYIWKNISENEVIVNPTISAQNSYIGSVLQQATSVVTETNQMCYEGETGCYSIYGFEVSPVSPVSIVRLLLICTGTDHSTFLDLTTRCV